MDKLAVFIFPAITFGIIAAGIVLFEIGKYINTLF